MSPAPIKNFAQIEKQPDGMYLVEFPELKGCLTEGRSLPEALKNAKEALSGNIAARLDRGLPIPTPKSREGKNYHAVQVATNLAVQF